MSRTKGRPDKTSLPKAKMNAKAQALAPDLEAIRRFIVQMIARGAIAEMIAAVLALLQKMRDLNTELMTKIAAASRKRPPSETLRRLQLELPLMFGTAANDASGAEKGGAEAELEGPPEPPPPPALVPAIAEIPVKKRRRHSHGRPNLPGGLLRVPGARSRVSDADRICPTCKRPTKTLGFKTTEKLTVRPCEFVVEQETRETCSCGRCHAYIVSAPKPDEVVARGLYGNELLVQALVDHYDDGVPWERMERNARQQGVPLSANTLATSVAALVDRFEPAVEHIKERALASSFTAPPAESAGAATPTRGAGS